MATWRLITNLIFLVTTAAARPPERTPSLEHSHQTAEMQPDLQVEQLLSQMTLEAKIGQLLLVGFSGTQLSKEADYALASLHVGGMILFSRNVIDPQQVHRLTTSLQRHPARKIPLFIAIDQEGGNVVRILKDATVLPGNMALGATRSPRLSYLAGRVTAYELHSMGINMNLAPVLDVNVNPINPVIDIRSFGEDPELVGELGVAYIAGIQEANVCATAKHFPGHGDTSRDSHFGLPTLQHTEDELFDVELRPFRYAIEQGLDSIMTAHITFPLIDRAQPMPATLSERILTGMLRNKLHYNGVIITDDMEMRAIDGYFGIENAAVRAIRSGADMIMIIWRQQNKRRVFDRLVRAVRQGELSQERIDQSVRRILRLKKRRGILDAPLPDLAESPERHPVGPAVSRLIANRSVTLLKNDLNLLPLDPSRRRRVLAISPSSSFLLTLREAYPAIQTLSVVLTPSHAELLRDIAQTKKLSHDSDLVIVGVVNRHQIHLIRQLVALHQAPIVVASMGSPYLYEQFTAVQGYVCSYGYRAYSIQALVDVITGKTPARGLLPVSLPPFFPYGYQLMLTRQRG